MTLADLPLGLLDLGLFRVVSQGGPCRLPSVQQPLAPLVVLHPQRDARPGDSPGDLTAIIERVLAGRCCEELLMRDGVVRSTGAGRRAVGGCSCPGRERTSRRVRVAGGIRPTEGSGQRSATTAAPCWRPG